MNKKKSVHRTTIWRHRQAARFQPIRVSLREALNIRQQQTSMNATNSNELGSSSTHFSVPEQNALIMDGNIDQLFDTASVSSSSDTDDSDFDEKQIIEDDNCCSFFEQNDLFSPSQDLNGSLTSIELSVSLIILKARYHLSHECINDILRLFRECHIEAPACYKSMKNLLRKRSVHSYPQPLVKYVCPSCVSSSTSPTMCSSCSSSMISNGPSISFFNFDLISQIERVLCTSPNLRLFERNHKTSTSLRDIVDGEFYQQLLIAEQVNNFVTLTLNVDGVTPHRGSDLSIWPVFLVINEIEIRKRFALENLIVGGIWPGPIKPSREQMFLLFAGIIEQLKVLEKGKMFKIYSADGSTEDIFLKVFLVACCCDKPAQSLLQRIAEPIAKFGCGSCEIAGIYDTQGRCNTFVINGTDVLQRRNNGRHDELVIIHEANARELADFIKKGSRGREKLETRHRLSVKGIRGPCVLRPLAYFDVGASFLVDSLHNVYLGVFRRLLFMWLDATHRHEPWSIHSQLNKLNTTMTNIHFPSTTTRRPRSITKFNKFKGNELRSLLLFGYSIFEGILQRRYYSHFLLLVLIMHLSESRSLDHHWVQSLPQLCSQFVLVFPDLYSPRHNVQVIHSIIHIPDAVNAYGPLCNYSTFNFESLLGLVTRTCNSTKQHSIEIINTLVQLREAHQLISTNDVRPTLQYLLSKWVLRWPSLVHNQIRPLHQLNNRSIALISAMWNNKKISYYSTIYIGHVRVTTAAFADQKRTDDSSIIVKINDIDQFAVVKEIFSVEDEDSFFQVCCLSTKKSFVCSAGTSRFSFYGIQQGRLQNDFVVPCKSFVEKCVRVDHPSTSLVTFIRFPNLCGSS